MTKHIYLYTLAIFIALGGMLSGYDTGVISGALLYINKSFQINSYYQGLLVASVSLGAILGAIFNGLFIDKIGRKKTLLIIALIFALGSICCWFSQNIIELILSRIIVGLACGAVSFSAPLYLAEISTKEKRGSIVSFYQVAITLGILSSYFVNYFCSNLSSNWRMMFLLGAIPAIILFFSILNKDDTPRWLVYKNRVDEAKKVLSKLDKNCDVDLTIDEIKSTLNKDEKIKFSKNVIKPFIIGIGIMFAQIATGINAIIYYAPTILKQAGFATEKNALLSTIFIGVVNFLMTFVAVYFVDKKGRKPLLYIGLSGMLISLLMLSMVFSLEIQFGKYLAIMFCTFYIISFSMSLGPIALLLISEVFPLKYRGSAMSYAIVANFIFNFITTGLFPISLDKLGASITFLIFALICIISLVFVYFIVPETKGITLEELENRFKAN